MQSARVFCRRGKDAENKGTTKLKITLERDNETGRCPRGGESLDTMGAVIFSDIYKLQLTSP